MVDLVFTVCFFAWRFSLGVGIMFVYWAGEIRSRFWSPEPALLNVYRLIPPTNTQPT